ncbi:MAG: hypothetical protein AB7O60_03870, partial [Variibacter sp.]
VDDRIGNNHDNECRNKPQQHLIAKKARSTAARCRLLTHLPSEIRHLRPAINIVASDLPAGPGIDADDARPGDNRDGGRNGALCDAAAS